MNSSIVLENIDQQLSKLSQEITDLMALISDDDYIEHHLLINASHQIGIVNNILDDYENDKTYKLPENKINNILSLVRENINMYILEKVEKLKIYSENNEDFRIKNIVSIIEEQLNTIDDWSSPVIKLLEEVIETEVDEPVKKNASNTIPEFDIIPRNTSENDWFITIVDFGTKGKKYIISDRNKHPTGTISVYDNLKDAEKDLYKLKHPYYETLEDEKTTDKVMSELVASLGGLIYSV